MSPERTCHYGHGSLELLMGWFSLVGVTVTPELPLGLLAGKTATARPNDQLLALRVWRCPSCGYVELVDDVTQATRGA